MLHALSLGAPPHGGIAPGIDRIVMLLCGEENLREVVLFPMNQRAEDLMMGAPSDVSPRQLGGAAYSGGEARAEKNQSTRSLTNRIPFRNSRAGSAAVLVRRGGAA
jgi:hypothetical protein